MKVTKEMIKAIDAIQDSDKLDGETKLLAITEILWMLENSDAIITSSDSIGDMFPWYSAPSGFDFWDNLFDAL